MTDGSWIELKEWELSGGNRKGTTAIRYPEWTECYAGEGADNKAP